MRGSGGTEGLWGHRAAALPLLQPKQMSLVLSLLLGPPLPALGSATELVLVLPRSSLGADVPVTVPKCPRGPGLQRNCHVRSRWCHLQ